jgi:hypothetical protein
LEFQPHPLLNQLSNFNIDIFEVVIPMGDAVPLVNLLAQDLKTGVETGER